MVVSRPRPKLILLLPVYIYTLKPENRKKRSCEIIEHEVLPEPFSG